MQGLLGEKAFSLEFDLKSGLCGQRSSSKRMLSDIAGIFRNPQAAVERAEKDNPLVYEFYELPLPNHPGDLCFGTSMVYPGQVDGEYFMTKGHFHSILDTGEVYHCLSGQGMMIMENGAGDWNCLEFKPGTAVYVPKGYAHRSINIGEKPLVTFFCFRADAGHDYQSITQKGFRNLVVKGPNGPEIIANPHWS
jgi:glucose-6-phosphate isomerase